MKDLTFRHRGRLVSSICAVIAAATLGASSASAVPTAYGVSSSDTALSTESPSKSLNAWRTQAPPPPPVDGPITLKSWRTQKRVEPSSSMDALLSILNSWRTQKRIEPSASTDLLAILNSWRTQKRVEPSAETTVSLNSWRTQKRVEPSAETTISLNSWRTQRAN